MAVLPLVNTFTTALPIWSTRSATQEEILADLQQKKAPSIHVNDQLQRTIASSLEAAHYLAQEGADNRIENHINKELASSTAYSSWRSAMPSSTPKSLASYQKEYPHCNYSQISLDINSIGAKLSSGQFLFHGGAWPGGSGFTTTFPFSTTFCPQVALREAEHKGKAYDAGCIELFVLRVTSPATNVFVYRQKGTNLGHEKEVLFAAGATLTLRNRTLIRNDYQVCKVAYGAHLEYKKVPIHVLEIDIS